MLQLNADNFVKVCAALGMLIREFDALKKTFPDQRYIPPPDPILKTLVKALRHEATGMKLKIIVDRCTELVDLLSKPGNIELSLLDHMINRLPERLASDLGEEVILQISPEHAQYYGGKKVFISEDLLSQLPEIRGEEERARACYALEEYTAAAFHLMRIMEVLVQAFAIKLNIKFNPNEQSWGPILGYCRDEINSWNKGHRNRPHKKHYSACCDLINGVLPQRNDLIHRKQNYDDREVLDLRGAVEISIKVFLKLPNLTVNP